MATTFLLLEQKEKKDECVFMWKEGEAFLCISTYVDDLFVLYNGGGRAMRDKVNETLKQTMEVTEKGEIEFALDMKIERQRKRNAENKPKSIHRKHS